MGLGKTIQSIAFLSAIVGDQIAEISFFKNRKRSFESKRLSPSLPFLFISPLFVFKIHSHFVHFFIFKKLLLIDYFSSTFKPALIVMPAGVIQQWAREFRKVFLPPSISIFSFLFSFSFTLRPIAPFSPSYSNVI